MSGLELRTGDLFAQHDVAALGHGVNAWGVMGAGIAKTVRARFPLLYQAYLRDYQQQRLWPGSCHGYWVPTGQLVYNIVTQLKPGPYANISWIRIGVGNMVDDLYHRGLRSVAIPRIGCGLGGLQWTDVVEALADVADSYPEVRLIVVTPA